MLTKGKKFHRYTVLIIFQSFPDLNRLSSSEKKKISKLADIQRLDTKQRIDLCNAAQKFADGIVLELPSPITEVPMIIWGSYEYEAPVKTRDFLAVLECNTLPVSYLELRDVEEYKWRIFVDSNTFDKVHTFEVKKHPSKPTSCSQGNPFSAAMFGQHLRHKYRVRSP